MVLLLTFAFLAGIVTIASPCILPVLPVVLSGSIAGGKRRPLGIVTGFVLSFTVFTLLLATLVRLTGVNADFLRLVSIAVIGFFGLSLLVPRLQLFLESRLGGLSNLAADFEAGTGYRGGVVLGAGLGLVWTPCVGPIMATVIVLAASGAANVQTLLVTLAYSLGTALPMLIIMLTGRRLLNRLPHLSDRLPVIQKAFGVLMVVISIGLVFNLDRRFQTFILARFPRYGTGLTALESNPLVAPGLAGLTHRSPAAALKPPLDIKTGYPIAPELIQGGSWFNSPPITLASLRGKVVLVDFWTYTCINCIRTLPTLTRWYAKYKDQGLVIIGVHTPEFEFEKNPQNVAKALKDFGIQYPVMQDNRYATWNAYQNQYWPAKYFIDKNGQIRLTHFGEGNENESEQEIQSLLTEAGATGARGPINNPGYQLSALTPESYLGYDRLARLASPEVVQNDQSAIYSFPASLPLDNLAYRGNWTVASSYAQAQANAQLALHFAAQSVYLVMRPHAELPGKITLTLDGQPIASTAAGVDVHDSQVTVDQDRLYTLIQLRQAGEHTIVITFLDNHLEAYAFTFG